MYSNLKGGTNSKSGRANLLIALFLNHLPKNVYENERFVLGGGASLPPFFLFCESKILVY